jgi:hypothetical protein
MPGRLAAYIDKVSGAAVSLQELLAEQDRIAEAQGVIFDG